MMNFFCKFLLNQLKWILLTKKKKLNKNKRKYVWNRLLCVLRSSSGSRLCVSLLYVTFGLVELHTFACIPKNTIKNRPKIKLKNG